MEYKNGKIHDVALLPLKKYLDDRGYLVEIFRSDTLPTGLMPEMAYVSFTEPGVGRGPHEHETQTDIFTFIGPGNFKVYLWDARPNSETYGNRHIFFAGTDNPLTVTVPPGVVHGYKNISKTERGMVINGPDKLFAGKDKKEKVDEIRHEENQDQFFKEFESL
ncbi:MAG: dTDP-4-dehydrorhamnose 3,5-epimerase family protein [Spirochaetales bacterium]|nr:dTDP-4-dehydrorhamnose 3,5-epimerase family protein [Spirochaetales bacterium]